jgi:hypothetical protein
MDSGAVLEFDFDNIKPGFKVKDGFRDVLPGTQLEAAHFDWSTFFSSRFDDICTDSNVTSLAEFVLVSDKIKMTSSSVDTSSLTAPSNSVWRAFSSQFESAILEENRAARSVPQPSVGHGMEDALQEDENGFTKYQRHFVQKREVATEVTVDPDETQDPEAQVEPPAIPAGKPETRTEYSYKYDLDYSIIGPPVKFKMFESDCFKLQDLFDENEKYAKKMSVAFADPPWGVNTDVSKMGGIDLKEERWGK